MTKAILATLLSFLAASAPAQKMAIATYNLRYDNKADVAAGNGWEKRAVLIARFIAAQGLDIMGTQEGLSNQLADLKRMQPDYDFIGVGRDDGKDAGEHSAIFYRKSRLELLSKGNFWLSAVTDRPNKGWDAALPRICTWGKFRDRKSDFTFYCFNLHMDHVGKIARKESAKLVLDTIRRMAGDVPVILMGDFNVDQRDTSYTLLQNSGLLQDAYMIARNRSGAAGTFNNFDTARHSDNRIDHIFLGQNFRVLRYAIQLVSYQDEQGHTRYASDHHPVVISLRY